jgi:hypothetical protein
MINSLLSKAFKMWAQTPDEITNAQHRYCDSKTIGDMYRTPPFFSLMGPSKNRKATKISTSVEYEGLRGLWEDRILKAASKNVIPVKTGIQKPLTSLDSRLRGSDKLIIIRGSH